LAKNCFKPDFGIFEKDKMIFLSKIGLLAYTCLVDFYQKNWWNKVHEIAWWPSPCIWCAKIIKKERNS
jgi:hypothetical protein